MTTSTKRLATLTAVLFVSASVVLAYLAVPAISTDFETGRPGVDLLRLAVPASALLVLCAFCFMLGRFHENPKSL